MAKTTRTRSKRTRSYPKPIVTPAKKAVRTIRATVQRALQAGVKTVSGARDSASGAFDALVKRGAVFENRSRRGALAKARQARQAASAGAEVAKASAVDAVSHLEKVLERRISRAVATLGIPSARDIRVLSRLVTGLKGSVEKLQRARARAAR